METVESFECAILIQVALWTFRPGCSIQAARAEWKRSPKPGAAIPTANALTSVTVVPMKDDMVEVFGPFCCCWQAQLICPDNCLRECGEPAAARSAARNRELPFALHWRGTMAVIRQLLRELAAFAAVLRLVYPGAVGKTLLVAAAPGACRAP